MPATEVAPTSPRVSRTDNIFPTLTPPQLARVAAHGRRRAVTQGEILVEQGDQPVPFFVIVSGEIEIVRPTGDTESRIVAQGSGQFTGEANMLSGRRSLVRARVLQSGELIELNRDELLRLVQTDAELSEIVMRAFILRRVELIAHGLGDVVLIGSSHCPGTLRVKEFLTRNGHPYTSIDLDTDDGVQDLLDKFGLTAKGRTSAHLPLHGRTAQSDERADRGLPRLQRGDRRPKGARSRCDRCRTCRSRGGCVRGL